MTPSIHRMSRSRTSRTAVWKWWDPVRLQQRLDLLSSKRLEIKLRLELRVAAKQSSKLESPKNYKILFTEIPKTPSLTFLSSWHQHQGGKVNYNHSNIWQAQNTNIFQISSHSLTRLLSCVCMQRDATSLLCESTLSEEDDRHPGKGSCSSLIYDLAGPVTTWPHARGFSDLIASGHICSHTALTCVKDKLPVMEWHPATLRTQMPHMHHAWCSMSVLGY